ncbi:MAG: hypothetical protein K2Y51_13705 [Gammaproteobacteria bacterium]|nr:hypothetical protein [Gammaproteobacteria bacterium]
MAITITETQVTWSASNSASVTAGSSQTSDAVALDATCIGASVTLKADNSTTPASDDIIYFWLLQTNGDPDGAGSDEYDTVGHSLPLAILRTNSEDPAIKTVPLPIPQKGLKIYAEGITAGTTNSITVSATITEQRAA